MSISKITPCLWFNDQAEEAARFYIGIFPQSEIITTQNYTSAGKEHHGHQPGSVMTMEFKLNGVRFTALNGGPQFRFSEAISFQINCIDQDEVDYYWLRLGEGGDESQRRCGWLADRFGLVWQIIPQQLVEMLGDPDIEKVKKVTLRMMEMQKLDVAVLKSVYEGDRC